MPLHPPPSLFSPPLSSLFSPSLTKTYVTRLSPPNTSSLQSTPPPLIFPWSETCEERGGGRNREREGKSLEEVVRHLWTLEGKRLACLHQITSAWETVGKIAGRWVWERHRVVGTFSWNACVSVRWRREGGVRHGVRHGVRMQHELLSCTDGLFPEPRLLLCHFHRGAHTHFIMQCCAYKWGLPGASRDASGELQVRGCFIYST